MSSRTKTKKKPQRSQKKPIVQRNKPKIRELPESDPYAADLRWYLQGDWRGDMGVRALQFHDYIDGGTPMTVPDDSLLVAAARYRRLKERWARVPPEHQATLQAYYGETRRILPEWSGAIGPVVLLSPVTRALHRLSEREAHRRQIDALTEAHRVEMQRVKDAWEQVVVDRNEMRKRLLAAGSGADAIESLRSGS